MAIFHLHAQVVQRSQGRSSVAAAAYRLGVALEDPRTGITHDFSRKGGVSGSLTL
ncbi:MobA/MobL family protein, partial [Stenotrophomonas maltophilia]|nr:MobA/MobL family protein [Stenotrophomonas maltophilia]